jgi:hypothetical protein
MATGRLTLLRCESRRVISFQASRFTFHASRLTIHEVENRFSFQIADFFDNARLEGVELEAQVDEMLVV